MLSASGDAISEGLEEGSVGGSSRMMSAAAKRRSGCCWLGTGAAGAVGASGRSWLAQHFARLQLQQAQVLLLAADGKTGAAVKTHCTITSARAQTRFSIVFTAAN